MHLRESVCSGQPFPRAAHRCSIGLVAVLAAAAALHCGGSTAVETLVGPDGARCQTTLSGPTAPVPFDGGTVSVRVGAARDCTWAASSEASWLQLNSTSGQGDGSLTVTVSSNDVTTARSGAVVVNSQRVTISQEARPCTFELRASPETFTAEGGRGAVTVSTTAGCAWTADASADWLRVVTPSGTGPASVAFDVDPNRGGTREGAIRVAGVSVTIRQDGPAGGGGGGGGTTPCSFNLTPTSINSPNAGGTHSVALATGQSCDWRATTNASWLSASPSSGRSSTTLTISVDRNTGSARSGTVTVSPQSGSAGSQTVTVTQAAQACSYTLSSTSQSFPAGGGPGEFTVTTSEGCPWSASDSVDWVSTSGSGPGSGKVTFTVSNNTGGPRETTISVAGQSFRVSQEGRSCSYTLSSTSQSFPAGGGPGEFTVTTSEGCAWSASDSVDWVSTSGSGPGSGKVTFTVSNNTGPARETTISVAGQSFRVSQDAGATCSYTLSSTSQSFPAGGGPGEFTVTTGEGCAWSASDSVDWVSTSGSGPGSGKVTFTVSPNTTTSARETTISVAGQSFRITQEGRAACSYTLSSNSQSFPAGGGPGEFTVTTGEGCAWSASDSVDWVSTSGSGPGSGKVTFTVSNNTGPARETTISVAGQSFRVTQDAGATCSYTLSSTSQSFPAGGGPGEFTVTTGEGCAWSASDGVDWVSTSGSGPGSGKVTFTVSPNTTTSARETTISVAGQSFRITQEARACSYTLSSTSQSFTAAGGAGEFTVTTSEGCAWSASDSVDWVSTSGSGPGSGKVTFTVSINPGPARETTISVAGQSFRITQAAP